jgi:lipid-A-disaccharide synthase
MKIFISACEPSGDNIGAKLIRALKEHQPDIEIYGLGGKQMTALSLKSLFDIELLSVMGFLEVLPRAFKIKRKITETADYIRKLQPDVIITIDSYGFHSRLITRLQDLKAKIKFYHYVAPTVWAYKPKRKFVIKNLYHHLFCILPFEPKYFTDIGASASFVGHPVLEDMGNMAADFNLQGFGFAADKPILTLMPGSRLGEIRRHAPIFAEVAEKLADTFQVFVPTLPHLEAELKRIFADSHAIVSAEIPRHEVIRRSALGLVKSGTSSMEMTLFGIPHVVAYRANPISYFIIKKLIKINTATVANLIVGENFIPEFFQDDCNSKALSDALLNIYEHQAYFQTKCTEALQLLNAGQSCSNIVAKHILNL